MSNPEDDDSVVRQVVRIYLLVFVRKVEKVVRKIASQEHCNGDVTTQQTYRRYYASCHTDFI